MTLKARVLDEFVRAEQAIRQQSPHIVAFAGGWASFGVMFGIAASVSHPLLSSWRLAAMYGLLAAVLLPVSFRLGGRS